MDLFGIIRMIGITHFRYGTGVTVIYFNILPILKTGSLQILKTVSFEKYIYIRKKKKHLNLKCIKLEKYTSGLVFHICTPFQ